MWVLCLALGWLPSYVVKREKEQTLVSSFPSKGTNPSMENSPSWPTWSKSNYLSTDSHPNTMTWDLKHLHVGTLREPLSSHRADVSGLVRCDLLTEVLSCVFLMTVLLAS